MTVRTESNSFVQAVKLRLRNSPSPYSPRFEPRSPGRFFLTGSGMSTIVPMQTVPKDASEEERTHAFFAWCQAMAEANPNTWLPLGVRRRWFHFIKIEHPFTRKHLIHGAA